jgi:SanA protein
LKTFIAGFFPITNMLTRKRIFILLSVLMVAGILTVFYCDKKVRSAAEGKTFTDVGQVPHRHVGLLLGTGKYLGSGRINPYYFYRIEATTQLLKAGKIDYVVISGDNSRKDYSEPDMMKADLIAAGIDSTRIYLDFAGFRTFDSMIRLREIFSQNDVTVISQKFHNERALYIARREGINAIGFNADDVSASAGFKTQVREKLARVKVFADYLFGVDPKFLGPKISIP